MDNEMMLSPAPQSRVHSVLWVVLFGLFLLVQVFTAPNYVADTSRYANDVIQNVAGRPAQFWEFGHLLWRPWGYVGLQMFGNLFSRLFQDTSLEGVARFLTITAWLCSLIAAASLFSLLRRSSFWAAWLAMLGFLFANPFLNYSRAGTSYIPALCFLFVAMWCASKSLQQGGWWAAVAGLCFAISFAAWYPFVLAGGGVIAFFLWWRNPELSLRGPVAAERWRLVAPFCLSAAVAGAVIFAIGAVGQGVHTPAGFLEWVKASDNGWAQRLTVVRLATGMPRGLFDLGSDGMILKRWFFHDPYYPTHLRNLAPVLIKIGAFFAALLMLFLGLIDRKSRSLLVIFLLGAGPVILFAVLLFEPGSPERYLPAYPFFFLAAAGVLERWHAAKVPPAVVAVVLILAAITNVRAVTATPVSQRKAEFLARKSSIQSSGQPTVFVATLHDDFCLLPGSRPLDHDLRLDGYDVHFAVELASHGLPAWKARFALSTLEAWKQHRDVWFSKQMLNPAPATSLNWVEGDDARIHWKDLPAFFSRFQAAAPAQDAADGFLRIEPTPQNRELLEEEARTCASMTDLCNTL